jgi:hypothetical protein
LFQGEKYTRIVNENSVASTSTGVTLKHEASDSQVVEFREIAGIHCRLLTRQHRELSELDVRHKGATRDGVERALGFNSQSSGSLVV